MAKVGKPTKEQRKVSFGKKKTGVQKKKRNKHESVKAYNKQGR